MIFVKPKLVATTISDDPTNLLIPLATDCNVTLETSAGEVSGVVASIRGDQISVRITNPGGESRLIEGQIVEVPKAAIHAFRL